MPRIVASQSNNDIATGIQLFEAKKFSEAKQFFASYAKNNSKDPVAAYYQGRLFLRDGNYDQAIDWLEQATKLDETNSDYHFWLGRAYGVKAQRAGMLKKASAAKNIKKSFERAVELNPANLDARMGLLQFYVFAPGIMGGSKDKARDQAKEISKQNAHQGYLAFGLIHAMNEQFGEAKQA
ncbi:MAG: tetratricopeptide repeat protein, partial [bacterium]|nr:tetratricopeptide repeat protein [bacterium]